MYDFRDEALMRKRQMEKERKISQLKVLINQRLPEKLDALEWCGNQTARQLKIRDTREVLASVKQIVNTM